MLGIRLRRPGHGAKLAVKAGHEGLFIPSEWNIDRLLIAEEA